MSFVGDFNFYFDGSSAPQVNRLKTMLSDFGLSQPVCVPTNRRGHTLDWVVVRSEESPISLERVQDDAGLLDHFKPPPSTRLLTSRNIRAVRSSDFQDDVKALVDSTGKQLSDLDLGDLVDIYNNGLRQVLDRHAPSVTSHVRDRPSLRGCLVRSGRHDDRGDEPSDDEERPALQCTERSLLKRELL